MTLLRPTWPLLYFFDIFMMGVQSWILGTVLCLHPKGLDGVLTFTGHFGIWHLGWPREGAFSTFLALVFPFSISVHRKGMSGRQGCAHLLNFHI